MYCLNLDINMPQSRPGQVVKPVRDRPRRFECHICQKIFKRREHLDRHVSTQHKGEKPHVCSIVGCEKRYTRREELMKHFRIHHEAKPDDDDESKRSPVAKQSDRDQRAQRIRVLLPRVKVTEDMNHVATTKYRGSVSAFPCEASGNSMRAATAPSTYTESLDALATAAFHSEERRGERDVKTSESASHHTASTHLASTTNLPVPLSLSSTSSQIQAEAYNIFKLGPDSLHREYMNTSGFNSPQIRPPRKVTNCSTSVNIFRTRETSPQSPTGSNSHNSLPPLVTLAYEQGPMTMSTVSLNSMACAQPLPPTRALPVSSLLCPKGSCIEDIFNGCTRELPPPLPP